MKPVDIRKRVAILGQQTNNQMKSRRIHYLQHVPFEDLGYIKTWASQNGFLVSGTRLYEDEEFPGMDGFDWLIVLGGPMGVDDEGRFSWLKAEKEFIQDAIEADKTVIGICLGAQMLASVLGAEVYPAMRKEIGWFPIHQTGAGLQYSLFEGIPETFTAFHWHGDTFGLPPGGVHLLHTENCPHQAFLYDDRILGIQFHFEVTPESVVQMVEHCRDELVAGEFIQDERTILEHTSHCRALNRYLGMLLDRLIARNTM